MAAVPRVRTITPRTQIHSMRLVVSADLHLGSPIRSLALRSPELAERLESASQQSLRSIVDLAIEDGCDAIVLGGDIFDNGQPDMRLRTFLVGQLSRAAQAGIPTVLIRGNHDAMLKQVHGALGETIHLLDRGQGSVEIGGAVFHGQSFSEARARESQLPLYPPPVPGRWNIGVMHTSLGGAPGHDLYAPCSVADLVGHGYDLWCLGHIHKPMVHEASGRVLIMPGIPQPRDFGERFGGAVYRVDLGPGGVTYEARPVGTLAFCEVELDLDAGATQDQVFTLVQTTLAALAEPGRDMAVRLRAATSRYPSADLMALALEAADGLDGVYIDKVKSVPPREAMTPEADDLLRLMLADLHEPAIAAAAAEIVEEMAAAMPSELREDIRGLDLDALVREAVEEVHLQLHRGGRA